MHQITSSSLPESIKVDHKPTPSLQSKPHQHDVLIDCAIAAAYFVLVAAWSLVIPLNGAPDELSHLFLVEYLVRFHSIPVPEVDPVEPFVGLLTGSELHNTVDWYYGLPFVHVLGATALASLLAQVLPEETGYLAARGFNWALGGIFIFALMRALVWSGVKGFAARSIAVLIATIPQVTFIFAYFNHDAIGVTAVTLGLHAFLRTVKWRGVAWRDPVYLGATCGLILLAKPYHYPALLFFALMLVVRRLGDPAFPLKAVYGRAVAAAVLVALPFLAWTYFEFGEITGSRMLHNFLAAHPGYSSAEKGICYVFCNDAYARTGPLWEFLHFNFLSFFALLGWMDLRLPSKLYAFWFLPLTAIFFVSSVAFVVSRARGAQPRSGHGAAFDASFVALTLLMLLGTLAMSLSASQLLAPQPQGRYLFVVLPFVAYCVALLAEPLNRISRGAAAWILALLSVGMVCTNLYALLFVLSPAHRFGHGRGLPISNSSIRLNLNDLVAVLSISPTDLTITLPRQRKNVEGEFEVSSKDDMVLVAGWAFDRDHDEPAAAVVILHKDVPIEVAKVGTWRGDAAKETGYPSALDSGFRADLPRGALDPCSIQVLAIKRSLEVSKLKRGKRTCP